MDSLERCRVILGLSSENKDKLGLLQVLLDKARLDIEAFCRDSFKEDGVDVFPEPLKSVQEDLAIQRFRKRGAEGQSSYSLADESVTFDDPIPVSVEKRLYPYRRLFSRE